MQSNHRKTVTLLLGGARSGKSHYAQQLAERAGRVVFVATAQPGDDEMRRTFNMGLGMIVVVPAAATPRTVALLASSGARVVGPRHVETKRTVARVGGMRKSAEHRSFESHDDALIGVNDHTRRPRTENERDRTG